MIGKGYALNSRQVNKLRWTAITSWIVKHLWKESSPVKENWRSDKLLLALASIVILGSEPQGTHDHNLLSDHSGNPVQSSSVNCCWVSPAQSFLVSGPVGIDEHIFVLSGFLSVLKWDLPVDERRDLTTTSHSPSSLEWLCWLSLSLTPLTEWAFRILPCIWLVFTTLLWKRFHCCSVTTVGYWIRATMKSVRPVKPVSSKSSFAFGPVVGIPLFPGGTTYAGLFRTMVSTNWWYVTKIVETFSKKLPFF
jgi:hypothetical protein